MSQGIIAHEPNCNCDTCLSRDRPTRDFGESVAIASMAGGTLSLRRYPGGRAVHIEFHDAGGLRYSEPLRHLVDGAVRRFGWNGE